MFGESPSGSRVASPQTGVGGSVGGPSDGASVGAAVRVGLVGRPARPANTVTATAVIDTATTTNTRLCGVSTSIPGVSMRLPGRRLEAGRPRRLGSDRALRVPPDDARRLRTAWPVRRSRFVWLIGVSVGEYGALENGGNYPDFETWDRICELYAWPQTFVDGALAPDPDTRRMIWRQPKPR